MLYYKHKTIAKQGLISLVIGERIRFFRNLRGMTQKYLGMAAGFPERNADIRMAQYEAGTRTPKAELTASLANILGISPQALSVPDIDSTIGLAHTLFTLEDIYGLKIKAVNGEVCLHVEPHKGHRSDDLLQILVAWQEQAAKLESGEIDREEYDKWRHYYPEYDTTQKWAKTPSQELNDAMLKRFKPPIDD